MSDKPKRKRKSRPHLPPAPSVGDRIVVQLQELRLLIEAQSNDTQRVVIDLRHSLTDSSFQLCSAVRQVESAARSLNSAIYSVASSTNRVAEALHQPPWPARWWSFVCGWWYRMQWQKKQTTLVDHSAVLKQVLDRLPQADVWGQTSEK